MYTGCRLSKKMALSNGFKASQISRLTFKQTLKRYESYIPEKLKELEEYRMKELPKLLEERKKKSKGDVWLEKDELVKLVEWKLKHGTFRPKLLALVSSNSASDIKSITGTAFAGYSSSDSPEPASALPQLTKLKGIGPATASLILSVLDPDRAPFFGDQVFMWVCWDEVAKGKGGWDRKIGYTPKEYRLLAEKVREVAERLGVKAIEIEMVGYVLGKEKFDIEKGAAEDLAGKSGQADAGDEDDEGKKAGGEDKKGTKRSRQPERADESKEKTKKKKTR